MSERKAKIKQDFWFSDLESEEELNQGMLILVALCSGHKNS